MVKYFTKSPVEDRSYKRKPRKSYHILEFLRLLFATVLQFALNCLNMIWDWCWIQQCCHLFPQRAQLPETPARHLGISVEYQPDPLWFFKELRLLKYSGTRGLALLLPKLFIFAKGDCRIVSLGCKVSVHGHYINERVSIIDISVQYVSSTTRKIHGRTHTHEHACDVGLHLFFPLLQNPSCVVKSAPFFIVAGFLPHP